MRKMFLALTAAATLAVGAAAISAPAEAHHRRHHFGGVFIVIGGYNHRHCHTYRVWRHHHWVWVKKCHRHH
jgi:hypothetical protein